MGIDMGWVLSWLITNEFSLYVTHFFGVLHLFEYIRIFEYEIE